MQRIKKIIFIVATASCLSACAVTPNAGMVEHGIDVVNKGESLVSEILVQYGDVRREFCKRGCGNGSGSFYGVHMPIQDEMLVTWKTADGISHKAQFLVKAKLQDAKRFSLVNLQFYGEQLVAQQWSHYSNSSVLEFEKMPLFP